MGAITYTKNMNKFVIESAKKVGITKTNLGLTLGLASTYFCKKREQVQQENWDKTLAFFKKHDIEFKTAIKDGDDNTVFERFRTMAAEPGASSAHLKKVFGISASTYTRIISGANGRRARNILMKGFAKLENDTKKLAAPKAKKKYTKHVVKSSVVQTLDAVLKLQREVRSLLHGRSPDERKGLLKFLVAEET